MRILALIILFGITISCASDDISPEINGQSDLETTLINDLNSVGSRLVDDPLALTDNDMLRFNEVSQARIVGLGEATHGSREFFEMKHRIFKYLVEKHGFDAFLFEMDVAEARIFNDWVQWRRNDDLNFLMNEKMLFWVWKTEEVKALLEWMREHNQGKTRSSMISFYGVDTQFPKYDLSQLVEIIEQVDETAANSILDRNQSYLDIANLYTSNYSSGLLATVIQGIKFASQEVERLESEITNQLGEEQFLWAQQLVRHMEQVQQVTFDYTQNNRYHERDRFMAENVSWYFDLLGEDKKFVLWAHNGHVANDRSLAGIYGGSQGDYLKGEYEDDYKIIGFSFGKGSLSAWSPSKSTISYETIDEEPKAGSYNELLVKATADNYVLSVQTGPEELINWLNVPNQFLQIGSTYTGNPSEYYYNYNLHANFDYIVHFDEVSHSVLLTE